MRATAGAFHERGRARREGTSRSGSAGLMIVFVLAGLVIAGVLIAPDLVIQVKARNRNAEETALVRIHEGLVKSIERFQTIPSATNWVTLIAPVIGMDQTEVTQVYPAFASDTNTSRVFLIDPGLTSGLLPYTQGDAGLTGTQTNLLGSNARVMLVSNTKRSLTLPVTSCTPSSNAFYALWNWAYDATTEAPPSGWPAEWTANGEYLHVKRLNLPNEFHRVTCKNLLYDVGDGNTPTNLVTSLTTFAFLRGTRLALALTNGTFKRTHIVNRDILFDFSTTNALEAIGWWEFTETSGSVATNSGALGASADGVHTNGVTLGIAGPRPPAYTGYSSNNTAAQFDGSNDYVKGTNGLLNNVSGLTIAGWINPDTANFNNTDLFGQLDIAQVNFTTAGKIEFRCNDETKKLHYFYPYGAGEWHHIAGVADGANLYIYVDGVEVATRTYAASNYGSNTNSFNIGGNVSGSGNYFDGSIDEVVAYNRALSAAEVVLLFQGQVF